jgi:hypothetical protein
MPGRRALKAFGWALLLFIAVDLLCRALLPQGFLLRIEDLTRERMSTAAAPDIQIIGDSVARSGFLASALTDDKIIARSDALPGSGPVFSYFLLRDAFENGHVPKALVIAHSPHVLGQLRYPLVIGGFAHWREIPALARETGWWSETVYGVLTRLSYILMHRDSFRDIITNRDFSFFREPDSSVALFSDRAELKQFRKELPTGYFDKSRLPEEVSDFYKQPFKVTPENDRYFRRILDLAKAHNVKVYWVTLPTPAGVLATRSKYNFERDMLEYLRQFERNGQMTILRGEFTVYDDNRFRDFLHLNLAGAVKLGCELRVLKAKIIEELPAIETSPQRFREMTEYYIGAPDADDPRVVLDHYCATPQFGVASQ